MKFSQPLSALLLLLFTSAASAVPSLSTRDVWAPPVETPAEGDVWVVGTTVTVTWDATNPPKRVSNPTGLLLLGHMDSQGSENLDIKHPLVTDFPLSDGKVSVVVPDVPHRDNYIVALLGDSGNISPLFTITPP
ncbi:hypothetical protein BV25DRAFT_1830707 [Artomyces pyxidatus]|uniref:Uncharacterized protein n=1 Tax=Artomyces pyxidatus TaxID=48021 RepID=A0ACB8SMV2_9AGAM|nr:hypothetical protein BV25DRAFT_1830707 [Artomyces pyxidatus]